MNVNDHYPYYKWLFHWEYKPNIFRQTQITGSMKSAAKWSFGGGDGTVSAAQQGMRNQKEKLSPCAKWLRREIPQMPSGSQWFPVRIIQAGWCSHGKPCAFCSAISQQPHVMTLKEVGARSISTIRSTSPVKLCIFTWHDWHVIWEMSPDLGQVWTNVYDECGSSNDSPSSYFEAILQKSFLLATCLITLFALQLQDSMNHTIGLILSPTLKKNVQLFSRWCRVSHSACHSVSPCSS